MMRHSPPLSIPVRIFPPFLFLLFFNASSAISRVASQREEKGANSRRGVEVTRPLSLPFVRQHVDFSSPATIISAARDDICARKAMPPPMSSRFRYEILPDTIEPVAFACSWIESYRNWQGFLTNLYPLPNAVNLPKAIRSLLFLSCWCTIVSFVSRKNEGDIQSNLVWPVRFNVDPNEIRHLLAFYFQSRLNNSIKDCRR